MKAPALFTLLTGVALIASAPPARAANSFTEVDHFGPSVIPQINDLLNMHGAQPNAACSAGFAKFNADPAHNNPQLTSFMLPGQSFTDAPGAPGTELYQCCIHPWMQAVITTRADERDRDR